MLESEVPLPALPVEKGIAPDIRVSFLPGGEHVRCEKQWDHRFRDPSGAVVLALAREGAGYRLGVPGLAEFVVDGEGCRVGCRPEPELPLDTLQHLLADQVLPRVLTFRGTPVFHAGCVASRRGAVAFLGDSGTGKSTLCAAFARAGWTIVSDDAVVVHSAPAGESRVLATYPGLRLHPGGMDRFLASYDAVPMAHYSEKVRVRGVDFDGGPFPLRAFYVLSPRVTGGDEIRVEPVKGPEAFVALMRATFQLHLDDAGQARGLFDRLGALSGAVPVRRLIYPRAFDALPAVVAAVASPAASGD